LQNEKKKSELFINDVQLLGGNGGTKLFDMHFIKINVLFDNFVTEGLSHNFLMDVIYERPQTYRITFHISDTIIYKSKNENK